MSADRRRAEAEIKAVNDHLAAGYPPTLIPGHNKIRTATRAAADALKVGRQGFLSRVGTPGRPGLWHDLIGLSPDWSLYKPAEGTPGTVEVEVTAPSLVPSRQRVALEDELRLLRAEVKQAQRAANTEEIIREIVGTVAQTPRSLPDWLSAPPKRAKFKPTPEAVCTIWSDWHLGEVVERAEVNGANAFNLAIAEERVNRLIDSTINLCRNHHTGVYPGIVVNLIGDFISGGLHDELKKTDELEVLPASLKAADWLYGGIKRLADEFGRVYLPCAAGNHGRQTVRPEFKRYYRKNYDWLIYQLLIRDFADDKRVQFDDRPSNDVHYRVYNERYLACHGDMLGVKGGDGIIGSIGPITRGEVKQAGQASALGLAFDKLVIGHWHQRLWLPRAIVNNALKGFDEFAMKALGAKPDRPTQTLWFVHPSTGTTAHWDIYVDEKPAPAKEWVAWQAA